MSLRGHHADAIAKALRLRKDTFPKHVQAEYRKIGVRTRQEFTAHVCPRLT